MKAKITKEKLKDIFYSGFSFFPDGIVLDELVFCLSNDVFLLTEKQLELRKQDFYADLEKVKASEGPGNQGRAHMVLKQLASKIIVASGLTPKTGTVFYGNASRRY